MTIGAHVKAAYTYNSNCLVIVTEIQGDIEVEFQGNERDITDRESETDVSRLPGASMSGADNQEATLPEISVPGASQSGVSYEEASLPGSGAPGTRLPRASCDRAHVEDLMRQLRRERLLRKRAERALVNQKRIHSALKKKTQFD